MPVGVLSFPWLEQVLEDTHTEIRPDLSPLHQRSWEKAAYVGGATESVRGRCRVRMFTRCGHVVTSVGRLEPVPVHPHSQPRWVRGRPLAKREPRARALARLPSEDELQEVWEQTLRELVEVLAGLTQALAGTSQVVMLEGGGSLVLPQCFLRAMRDLGVEVVVLGEEASLPESLLDLGV